MRLPVLRRLARGALFAGAVAVLFVAWSGVALADDAVPEISLGAVGGAMTLLSGSLLLLRERLRDR